MSLYVCTETARLQTEAACQTISTRADLAATFFSAAQAHLRPHPKSIFLSAFCGVTGMGCDLLSVCLGGNHHVPADLEARSRRASARRCRSRPNTFCLPRQTRAAGSDD